MPIRRSPNGAHHARPQPGRDRPERVVAINRNDRKQSIGTGGRHHPVRGLSPRCRDPGELVLQKALYYLAFGNVSAVRELLENYEQWLETGKAGWPFDPE